MKNWRVLTMSEIWDFLNPNGKDGVFAKPHFPSRRWGQIYTTRSTTNKVDLVKIKAKYEQAGFKVRRKIDYAACIKFPKLGKFYMLEILETDS